MVNDMTCNTCTYFNGDCCENKQTQKGDFVKTTPENGCIDYECGENSARQYKEKLTEQKKKSKDNKKIMTNFMDTGTELFQQVYDYITHTTHFVVSNDGHISTASSFKICNEEYIPISGEELKLGVVLLPSAVADYGSTLQLIEDIKNHLHTYLDITPEYKTFAAWYVLLSWVYDQFNTINYLRALGDTGCGKTRFLNVIGGLCYNATKGSGAVSVAALKRITKKWKGTVIVDEGDFKDSDEKNELTKYFNLGFEKDSPMINCDKNDPNKLEFYIPYCPKVIATRRQFSDKALEARCLTHIMKQTHRKDIPYVLPTTFYQEQLLLRNKLLKFRLDNYRLVNADKVVDLTDIQIEPRLMQATAAFASLFANNDEALEAFKRFIVGYQNDLVQERADSYDGQIVNIWLDYFINQEQPYVTSKMIADALVDRGFKASAAVVGKHLRVLGFTMIIQKYDGKTIKPIIIEPNLLKELNQRYCDEPEKAVTVLRQLRQLRNTCDLINNSNMYISMGKCGGGLRQEQVDIYTVTAVTAVTDGKSMPKVNSAVTAVTAVTDGENMPKENNTIIPTFDVWLACSVCKDSPCAEFDGKLFCQKHWPT